MKGTWQTDSSSTGPPLLVVAVAVVAAAVAGPVVHAAEAVVKILLIAAVVLAGLAVAGLVGYVAWRARTPADHRASGSAGYPADCPPGTGTYSAAPPAARTADTSAPTRSRLGHRSCRADRPSG